jgi:D-sedoheptulose 7-phosphate isomerase
MASIFFDSKALFPLNKFLSVMTNSKKINRIIEETLEQSTKIIADLHDLSNEINKTANLIIAAINKNRKIIIIGNGGSAADAQHIAAEFLGRYKLKRKSIPAIALTSNSSTTTAIANDYDFSDIFSRQCESLVSKGDIVIGISTSGNSENVVKGLRTSKKNGGLTIGLLGNKGGKIKNIVDIPLIVKATSIPRIQEAHRVIYHIICEIVEEELARIE